MTASIAGELVTERFEYDGGRPVTVYIPPDPPWAVVFAGDGQLISQEDQFLGGDTCRIREFDLVPGGRHHRRMRHG